MSKSETQRAAELEEDFGVSPGQARLMASVMAGNKDGDVVQEPAPSAAAATTNPDEHRGQR